MTTASSSGVARVPDAGPLADDPRVREVLTNAPVLHSAVDTGRGLHVTPTAFSWSGGALWVVTTRQSVKVRALRRRPQVGLLLRTRRHDLVLTGEAELVDPLRLHGVARPERVLDMPFAAAHYLRRNYKHVAGVLRDATPGPSLVLDRLAIRVRPSRAVLLRGDSRAGVSEVLAAWGGWGSGSPEIEPAVASSAAATALDLSLLPAELRPLLRRPGPGCLAWPSVHGPLALPVHWRGNGAPSDTDAGLLSLVGGWGGGSAGLSLGTGGYRLVSKRGVLIRGTGTARRQDVPRDRAMIDIAARRVTFWEGDQSSTVPVPG
jgi:Pyridoxamine 5'-phosphate oxidase